MAAVHRGLEMVEEDAGFWRSERIAGVCLGTSQFERMATTIAWIGAVILLLFKLQDSVHHVHDRGEGLWWETVGTTMAPLGEVEWLP